MKKQIIFASRNEGKIKEIQSILDPLDISILSAKDIDLDDISETGSTFEENAKIKAIAAAKHAGLPKAIEYSKLRGEK